MSAAVKITRMDHTPSELRGLAAKTRDVAQSRRLLAIAMVREGIVTLTGIVTLNRCGAEAGRE